MLVLRHVDILPGNAHVANDEVREGVGIIEAAVAAVCDDIVEVVGGEAEVRDVLKVAIGVLDVDTVVLHIHEAELLFWNVLSLERQAKSKIRANAEHAPADASMPLGNNANDCPVERVNLVLCSVAFEAVAAAVCCNMKAGVIPEPTQAGQHGRSEKLNEARLGQRKHKSRYVTVDRTMG